DGDTPKVGIPKPPRASMHDLYDRMGRMEIRQEAIERMEYREPTTHLVMLNRSTDIKEKKKKDKTGQNRAWDRKEHEKMSPTVPSLFIGSARNLFISAGPAHNITSP
ncbi:hypothetical protein Tco_0055235, partial [Tanacetum coccineum]